MKPNSCAFMPCGETPESVPKAILTPHFAPRGGTSRRAPRTPPSPSRRSPAETARACRPSTGRPCSVGTRNVPFDFISDERLVRQEGTVLDRVDPGPDRRPRGEVAVGVRRGLPLQAVGLVDDRRQLLVGQLGGRDVVAERQDAAGGAHLDDVGAVLDVQANGLAALVRRRGGSPSRAPAPARTSSGGKPVLSQWPPVAPRAYRATSMRGPGVRPVVDRVAQADVEVLLGADVANGREPGLERSSARRARRRRPARSPAAAGPRRSPGRSCRPPRRSGACGESMNPGQQRRVAEVDHRRAGGHRPGRRRRPGSSSPGRGRRRWRPSRRIARRTSGPPAAR